MPEHHIFFRHLVNREPSMKQCQGKSAATITLAFNSKCDPGFQVKYFGHAEWRYIDENAVLRTLAAEQERDDKRCLD